MIEKISKVYERIDDYAKDNKYVHVTKALNFIYDKMSVSSRYYSELLHCLEVAEMLIDLHLNLEDEEIETLISAVLLHVYPESFTVNDLESEITENLGMSHEVYQIIDTITPKKNPTESEQQAYYYRIQLNRYALLAALADRGNVVQKLYLLSTWTAHSYINETKACYFPMGIYGKEHYHSILPAINVLMEKIKTLLEVSEVLLQRYEVRESELMHDILALREENATIRGIIAKFESEM